MKSRLRIQLQTDAGQSQRLGELQRAFAQVCNALAPLAQQTACWNRVALHHMAYKGLRQRFPDIGSQMVCNAIYSVSRACRVIYQSPNSPFNHQKLAAKGQALPCLQFLPQAPVYFDRHTLSLKDGQVSLFTLDGRMRFQLPLNPVDERRFRDQKLREIVLTSEAGRYILSFTFAPPQGADNEPQTADASADSGDLPEYVVVTDGAAPTVTVANSFAPSAQALTT